MIKKWDIRENVLTDNSVYLLVIDGTDADADMLENTLSGFAYRVPGNVPPFSHALELRNITDDDALERMRARIEEFINEGRNENPFREGNLEHSRVIESTRIAEMQKKAGAAPILEADGTCKKKEEEADRRSILDIIEGSDGAKDGKTKLIASSSGAPVRVATGGVSFRSNNDAADDSDEITLDNNIEASDGTQINIGSSETKQIKDMTGFNIQGGRKETLKISGRPLRDEPAPPAKPAMANFLPRMPSKPKTTIPAQAVVPPPPAQPQKKEKSGGFFSRLFGGGKEKKQTMPAAAPAQPAKQPLNKAPNPQPASQPAPAAKAPAPAAQQPAPKNIAPTPAPKQPAPAPAADGDEFSNTEILSAQIFSSAPSKELEAKMPVDDIFAAETILDFYNDGSGGYDRDKTDVTQMITAAAAKAEKTGPSAPPIRKESLASPTPPPIAPAKTSPAEPAKAPPVAQEDSFMAAFIPSGDLPKQPASAPAPKAPAAQQPVAQPKEQQPVPPAPAAQLPKPAPRPVPAPEVKNNPAPVKAQPVIQPLPPSSGPAAPKPTPPRPAVAPQKPTLPPVAAPKPAPPPPAPLPAQPAVIPAAAPITKPSAPPPAPAFKKPLSGEIKIKNPAPPAEVPPPAPEGLVDLKSTARRPVIKEEDLKPYSAKAAEVKPAQEIKPLQEIKAAPAPAVIKPAKPAAPFIPKPPVAAPQPPKQIVEKPMTQDDTLNAPKPKPQEAPQQPAGPAADNRTADRRPPAQPSIQRQSKPAEIPAITMRAKPAAPAAQPPKTPASPASRPAQPASAKPAEKTSTLDHTIHISAGQIFKRSSWPLEMPLIPTFTFETMDMASNRFAHANAMSVVDNIGTVYNPFFIYGDGGSGKTHFLHAMGYELSKKIPQQKIFVTNGVRFARGIQRYVEEGRTAKLDEIFSGAEAIIIDDIHLTAVNEHNREVISRVLNRFIKDKKQIIISSKYPPESLARFEELVNFKLDQGWVSELKPPRPQHFTRIYNRMVDQADLGLNEVQSRNFFEGDNLTLGKIARDIRRVKVLHRRIDDSGSPLRTYEELLSEMLATQGESERSEIIKKGFNDILAIPKGDSVEWGSFGFFFPQGQEDKFKWIAFAIMQKARELGIKGGVHYALKSAYSTENIISSAFKIANICDNKNLKGAIILGPSLTVTPEPIRENFYDIVSHMLEVMMIRCGIINAELIKHPSAYIKVLGDIIK